jgi:hypothetical protein
MNAGPGWGWFAAWAGVGALLTFSLLGALSIGVFVAPLTLLAAGLVLRAAPPRFTAFGLVSGAGLVCLGVSGLNRDYRSCPESGVLTVRVGESSIQCGGFDPLPFLVAGVVLTLAGLALVAVVRHRSTGGRLG